jgi:peroxiredoxin
MANYYTGDYEAVFQVSVRQINGILATLHQNGAKDGTGSTPSFHHSEWNVRVAETPKYLEYETIEFSKWLSSAVQTFQVAGGPPVSGADLAAKAPPGIARRFHAALEDLDSIFTDVASPGSVRGRAEVQISTPEITVPLGSSDQVEVKVEIRARFVPDQGSGSLPEPIHGEIKSTYRVRPRIIDGKRVLTVEVPQDDEIKFKDLANLPAPKVAALMKHIRAAVRKDFKPKPVDMPPDFDFFQFREMGGGQVIAMPLQLSAGPAPPALHTLTNAFLKADTEDFALAVSKDYVTMQFAPTLHSLRQYQESFVVDRPEKWPEWLPWTYPRYHLAVTGVALEFKHGSIDLVINARATTDYVGHPNYESIVVTQELKLGLIVRATTIDGIAHKSQSADLQVGNLTIDGITGPFAPEARDEAREKIVAQRDKALPAAREALYDALRSGILQLKLSDDGKVVKDPDTSKPPGAGKRLDDTLAKIDTSAPPPAPPATSARYTAIEIKPEGIIVRGAIDTPYHYQPLLAIGYTEDGKSFSALNCWIPGGRITKFTWYWAEEMVFDPAPSPTGLSAKALFFPGAGVQESQEETHVFTFPIPAALKDMPAWAKGVCLSIEGEQVDRDGNLGPGAGYFESGSCEVSSPYGILVADPLWEAVYGIFWGPRPPDVIQPMEEQILAHINVLAHPRPAGGLTSNALVHFPEARPDRLLHTLSRALEGMRRPSAALTLVIVLPLGTFRNSADEVQELLGVRGQLHAARPIEEGADDKRIKPCLLLTEDYNGAWTRTFDARATPATYLVNARGEFVWKQEGRLDVEALAAAMDEHFLPAPAPKNIPLRLTVRPGDRALDAPFEARYILALDRLRGQQVLVNFWQSWSAPCLRELRRLQRLHEEAAQNGLVILGVNGGEDRSVLAEVRKQYNLTFPLIHDPGQRVATLYGVHCWPTTVSINPEGIVDRIQFGAFHTHRAQKRDAQAS